MAKTQTPKLDALIARVLAQLPKGTQQAAKYSIVELARDISRPAGAVWEWVIERSHRPSGEATLELAEWVSGKEKKSRFTDVGKKHLAKDATAADKTEKQIGKPDAR